MKRNKKYKLKQYLLLLLSIFVFSVPGALSQRTVTGTVISGIDEKPLPGVNISIKGTTTGTITDLDGNFSIEVSSDDNILVFSMIGMLSEEFRIGQQTAINLKMVEDLVGLDEVIVVGYGTMKKSDISGSIVSVGEEELSEVKSSNVLESLQGKAAGVDVGVSDGRSGSGVDIKIRGSRSLGRDEANDPLIVVDGIPYGSNIPINPSDIESVEILKDASSTAIYGSRGANGVILITTKKGTVNKTKVYFNAYYGFTEPYQKVPTFDRDSYINAKFDANRDTTDNYAHWNDLPDSAVVFSVAELEGVRDGTYNNWQDICTRNGYRQEYSLGILGGGEKLTYGSSMTYFNEKGVTLADDFKRYTFKLNVDGKINDYVSLGASTIITYRERNGRGVRFVDAVLMSPIVPAYDSLGDYIYQPDPANPRRHPLAYTYDFEQEMATRTFSSAYVQLNILPDLFFKSNVGVDFENERNGYSYPNKAVDQEPNTSGIDINNDYLINWTNLLNFTKEFSENTLNLTLGQEMQIKRQEIMTMYGERQPFSSNQYWNMGSAEPSTLRVSSGLIEQHLLSVFARASLNIHNLLILNTSGRYDGASVLTAGNKWSFFPSASGALRLNNLDFIANTGVISDLKARIGYGVSGNPVVNPYDTKGVVNLFPMYYEFGESDDIAIAGYRPEYLASEKLTWERTAQYNFGVDFGLFSNRIAGNIDAYTSISDDVILPVQLPLNTGSFDIDANLASVETKGFEVMLKTVNVNRGGFKWNMNVAFSTQHNKILSLASGITEDEVNNWFVGEPINVIYDYKKLGIWQLDERDEAATYGSYVPGDIKVEDTDKTDGKDTITTADRVVLGTTDPTFFGSWSNTFKYKGFDLTINLYARMGNMIDAASYDFDPRMYNNMKKVNYWTPHNGSNDYPRLDANTAEADYEETLSYQDGSFVKLKNITLGYDIPLLWIKKARISTFRVYFTSNNPLILYSLLDEGLDPERGGSINWPLARTYVFGLNLEF
ncbi:MAG: SusC/RagA family TonB-linked outer membrane protein [Bacteroidales bacterium]|nr:SusC/RagA family TonB-linked outer membrane protein [Bacteroidales bacterium]MBN2817525.1 SusC/RagA family TonB-linked outer membrane protein [Bacteroidales bacterium]